MRPIFKVPVQYGAIAGLLGGGLVIGFYYMILHPFLVPVFFDFRIFLFCVFIFFTLKELRDHYQGGALYFGQALMSSFFFVTTYALIASSIVGLFAYAEDEFVTSFIALFKGQVSQLTEAEREQIGKENIDRNLELLSSTNPFWMAWNYFKQCYWIGLLVSIILSVILRRQPKT